MSSDRYKIKVVCDNCGFRGEQTIPKGYKIKQARCGRCGVPALKKTRVGIWPFISPR